MATEAADAMSTRIRQSELLEKAAHLETTAKEAGARLAARWERERAAREREREQRERDAGERARQQRRRTSSEFPPELDRELAPAAAIRPRESVRAQTTRDGR